MSTATLTRPVPALPGPKAGALVAPHHDPRPCVTNPPQWWDTGDRNNHKAINLCRRACPFYGTGQCKPMPGEVGMIRDGSPYDDRGRRLKVRVDIAAHHNQVMTMRNRGMTYNQIGDAIGVNGAAVQSYIDRCNARIAEHHQRIAELIDQGQGWADIARQINAQPSAVRAYWTRYLQRVARETRKKPLVRLPGVTDESRNRPADYRNVIIAMLTVPGRPYNHAQVAYVIGSTRDAVRCYWNRQCQEFHGPLRATA